MGDRPPPFRFSAADTTHAGRRPQIKAGSEGRVRGGEKAATGVEPLMVTRQTGCQLLSLTARRFARLEASGVFVAVEPGRGQRPAKYHAAALVQALLAHSTAKTGAQEPPRDRRDRAVAEWTELRIDRERALLLPRDQVVLEGQRYIGAVQARLRAIVPRLRQETAVADGIGATVERLLEEAIEEMAGWRTMLDLLASTEDA